MRRIYLLLVLLLTLKLANSSELLLFKNYEEKLIKGDINEYLVSEKLDGIRAIWDGKILKTRKGNVINAPSCYIESLPPFVLDGELWTKRSDFENISSIVSQRNPSCKSWETITYNIFDVIPTSDFDSKSCENLAIKSDKNNKDMPKECSLLGRLAILQSYLDIHPNKRLIIIPQEQVKSKEILFEKLMNITKLHGEGLIIRKNNMPYQGGRNNSNLKLKIRQDSECKITGYTEGKGKLKGKMGAVICTQTRASLEQPGNNDMDFNLDFIDSKDKITFKIGSGWSDSLRDNPPKLNSIITYQYQGITNNGLPRFPTFLRIYKE